MPYLVHRPTVEATLLRCDGSIHLRLEHATNWATGDCDRIDTKNTNPAQTKKRVSRRASGWGTWIRTRECRNQNPVPYRLAIPQYHRYDSERICVRQHSLSTFCPTFQKCRHGYFFTRLRAGGRPDRDRHQASVPIIEARIELAARRLSSANLGVFRPGGDALFH